MTEANDAEDTTVYRVVVNVEEQYSIWRAEWDNPLGWRDGGMSGTKQECLEFIARVWTDMRPRSVREQMAGRSSSPAEVGRDPEGNRP
jgi:MbtH protein